MSCGVPCPDEPAVTCALAGGNPWPHQHVGHRDGDEPLEKRTITWWDAASTDHPSWCNKRHQPGANPRRQDHLRVWSSNMRKKMALRVEFYPCGGPAEIMLRMTSNDGSRDRLWPSITAEEARDFADVLYELAAAADAVHGAKQAQPTS